MCKYASKILKGLKLWRKHLEKNGCLENVSLTPDAFAQIFVLKSFPKVPVIKTKTLKLNF